MKTNRKKTNREIGDDFTITKINRRTSSGGAWVTGTIAGHKFNALVFAEHAVCPSYELDDSRISKLWLQRISDGKTVVNFDRGWDVEPTDNTAKAIVDFLTTGLADCIYHE